VAETADRLYPESELILSGNEVVCEKEDEWMNGGYVVSFCGRMFRLSLFLFHGSVR